MEWQPISTPPDSPRDVEIKTANGEVLRAWYCRGCANFHPSSKPATAWRDTPSEDASDE